MPNEVEYVNCRWRKYLGFLLCCVIGAVSGVVACKQGEWLVRPLADPTVRQEITAPMPAVPQPKQEMAQSVPARPRVIQHTVTQGENLYDIAEKYGIDTETIRGGNPELNGGVIYPGQQLNILSEKGILHTVKPEQTIWHIARQYGVDWQKILADNPGVDAGTLQPGDKVFVRGGATHAEGEVSRGKTDFFAWPAKGGITSVFGYRWGVMHNGIDIAADTGETIGAARGGRVTHAGWLGGYGMAVIIDHGRGWETLYGHASRLYVTDGDVVRSGQPLAAAGSTGNSTGPHLHFEMRRQGTPVNPLQFLP